MDIFFLILGVIAFIACGGFMAVVANPLPGKAYGSVGNATFQNWKGRNVLKSKVIKPKDPQTGAQKAQRNVFAAGGLLYRKMTFINRLVAKLPAKNAVDGHGNIGITETDFLQRVNQFNGTYTRNGTFAYTPTVDLTKLELSQGAQVGVIATAPTVLVLTVSTTWVDNTNPINPLANATDNVFLVAIEDGFQTNPLDRNNLTPEAVLGTTYVRTDAGGSIILPANWSGKTAHLYVVVGEYRPGTIPASTELIGVSDSFYAGSVAIP